MGVQQGPQSALQAELARQPTIQPVTQSRRGKDHTGQDGIEDRCLFQRCFGTLQKQPRPCDTANATQDGYKIGQMAQHRKSPSRDH